MALFGTPLGFLAAEEQANRTSLTQVNMQKLLGEIAQQPAETELRRAQARNQTAEAQKLEAAQADAAEMAGWESAARRAAGIVPATQGREATVEDVDLFRPGSVANPLRKLHDFMVGSGAPTRFTLPLANKIADITEKESISAYRSGQAENEKLESEKRIAEMVGSQAQAAMSSPQGYAQMRMLATQMSGKLPPALKKIIDGLPQDWEAGKAVLAPIVERALQVKDARDLAIKEGAAATRDLLAATTQARNAASAELAKARLGLVNVQTKVLEKIGGEGTPSAVAASEASTEAKYQSILANQLKRAPMVPIDEKGGFSKVTPGKEYTLPNGALVRAKVKEDGRIAFDELKAAPPKRAAPRTADQVRKDQRRGMKAAGMGPEIDAEEED